MSEDLLKQDMTPEEFRRNGHRVIDWIADYMAHPERYPVLSRIHPGDLRSALPQSAPEGPESFDSMFDDFEKLVVPGVTHWNHPGFMAYFAITGSGPGVLGDILGGALNINAMLWRTGPAATELEEVVMAWLRDLLGLPDAFFGVVMDTASISTLCAIAAARESLGLHIREKGMSGAPRLRLYTSEHAHSSVEKAAIVLGLGQEAVRLIPSDSEFRMIAGELASAIEQDRAAGWRPFAVVATIGTTSTTSIDPVQEIADIAASDGLWLHVDAAYAGPAAALPELRPRFAGWERADSIVLNPHKWMFTPFDFSAFFTRHPAILRAAFSLVPEYLRTAEDAMARNYMDYGVQLGRRFRALKLWFVMRYFGKEGIRQNLRKHMELGQRFASWVDADPNFERLAPVPFSVVCFRAKPAGMDEADVEKFNARLLDVVNASGLAFISHTKLKGVYTLRLAIGHLRTEESHVRAVWDLLQAETNALSKP
jgi:aromatic-L-amino-acid/L-tryptophan decarboxylase